MRVGRLTWSVWIHREEDRPGSVRDLLGGRPGWTVERDGLAHHGPSASTASYAVEAMGHGVLVVHTPALMFLDGTSGMELLAALDEMGAETGAAVGFVSTGRPHAEPAWIEDNVLLPLLGEDLHAVVHDGWARVFVDAAVAPHVVVRPHWRVVRRFGGARVFAMRETDNPWGAG